MEFEPKEIEEFRTALREAIKKHSVNDVKATVIGDLYRYAGEYMVQLEMSEIQIEISE